MPERDAMLIPLKSNPAELRTRLHSLVPRTAADAAEVAKISLRNRVAVYEADLRYLNVLKVPA